MGIVRDTKELMFGNPPGLSNGQFLRATAFAVGVPLLGVGGLSSLHAYHTVPADELASSDHVGAKILTMLGIEKAPDLADGMKGVTEDQIISYPARSEATDFICIDSGTENIDQIAIASSDGAVIDLGRTDVKVTSITSDVSVLQDFQNFARMDSQAQKHNPIAVCHGTVDLGGGKVAGFSNPVYSYQVNF